MTPLTKSTLDRLRKLNYGKKQSLKEWSLMRCINIECPCTVCVAPGHVCEYHIPIRI